MNLQIKSFLFLSFTIIYVVGEKSCSYKTDAIKKLHDTADVFHKNYNFDTAHLNKSQNIHELYSHKCNPTGSECIFMFIIGDQVFSDIFTEIYKKDGVKYVGISGSYGHQRDKYTLLDYKRDANGDYVFEKERVIGFNQKLVEDAEFTLPIKDLNNDLPKDSTLNTDHKQFVVDFLLFRKKAYEFLTKIDEKHKNYFYDRRSHKDGFDLKFEDLTQKGVISEKSNKNLKVMGDFFCNNLTQMYEVVKATVTLKGKPIATPS